MKLTPEYIEDYIWLSDAYHYYIDKDELMIQAIDVDIMQTVEFDMEFDKLRAARGFKPFFADLPKDQLDLDGWYEMMIVIEDKVATKIIAYATNSNDDDDEPYEIPLERETGIAIYKKIMREVGDLCEN